MGLTYRGNLNRPLTTEEIDGNFQYFTGSHAITGSLTNIRIYRRIRFNSIWKHYGLHL